MIKIEEKRTYHYVTFQINLKKIVNFKKSNFKKSCTDLE